MGLTGLSGGERQDLPDAFVFEFWIFAFEFGAVGESCQCLTNAADGKTEISNARFAIHPRGVDRDSVKFLHAEFSQSQFPEHTRSGRWKHQRPMRENCWEGEKPKPAPLKNKGAAPKFALTEIVSATL
jgi:hypothetical protein